MMIFLWSLVNKKVYYFSFHVNTKNCLLHEVAVFFSKTFFLQINYPPLGVTHAYKR